MNTRVKLTLRTCAVAVLFVGVSCAKESSKSDKNREQSDREIARLTNGAGKYYGYVSMGEDANVPAMLDLSVKRNPEKAENEPRMQAAFKIGLFGGVTIASDATTYDWDTGRLTASFARKDGSPFELTAVIKDQKFVEGTINGPNQGRHPLILDQKDPQLMAVADSSDFNLGLRFSDQETGDEPAQASAIDAVFTINAQSITVSGSQTFDLPLLPAINASFRFARLAKVPVSAASGLVLYDPLRGKMQIFTSATDQLVLRGLFLRSDFRLVIPAITGEILRGADHLRYVRSMRMTDADVTKFVASNNNPPALYRGWIRGRDNAPAYPVIAYMDMLGEETQNPTGMSFGSFPTMRLRVVACLQKQPFARMTLQAASLNHIRRSMSLTNNTATKQRELLMTYNADWTQIEGRFKSLVSTGDVNAGEPRLHLEAAPDSSQGCAQ